MNRRDVVLLATAVLCFLLVGSGVLAQGSAAIAWWVIGGGGAPSSGGNVTLNDSLGQPIIGPSSGGNVWLEAGYWGGRAVEEGPPPPPPIPVGGYIVPVSKFGLLVPWMGLVTLVGLILSSIVVVLRKRKRR